MKMTVVNKASAPVPFNAKLHFRATEKVEFRKTARNPGGAVSGLVERCGSAYLLRLRENPSSAQWVVFPAPKEESKKE